MRVNTIYPAFMGEVNPYGIGAPCVFVRFAGCNLRCYKNLGMLCDTPEALDFKSGDEMSINKIVDKVLSYNLPLVCVTGGEPLCHPKGELLDLFTAFLGHGLKVVVETNGSQSIRGFKYFAPEVSFIVDYKADSSGEHSRMVEDNWPAMRENDWLKFVLYDKRDVAEMLEWCEKHYDSFRGHISAGLFWGTSHLHYGKADGSNTDLLHVLLSKYPQYGIHLNFQTHKLISLYDQDIERVQKTIVPKDL